MFLNVLRISASNVRKMLLNISVFQYILGVYSCGGLFHGT